MFRRRPTSSPVVISTGSLLNNRYRLQEQLGEGGAGVVYKAEDHQLGRIVAIKLLTSEGHMAGDKLERFKSEARSVARLNHPNIITLYDYEEEQGRPYLVIEYIPGQDLWEMDNQYAPNLMPFEVSLPIIDGILAALEYSHGHQVIHRDLKPENVMITPDRQVKVMDFGLARIEGQSRLTQDGLVAGTAAYLAPELAIGEPGDHRVDLYALGIMIYELLTGRRPFSGDDPLTVISQHIHAPIVPPKHYNPTIPDDLQNIILKLLAKRADDRYPVAGEVRQDLAPILVRLTYGSIEEIAAPAATRPSPTDPQTLLERLARGKMIGRESELQTLKEHWDKIRLGSYEAEPLVLVSGEGGLGKTRLLRELQVYTALRDGYVLHGVAHEEDIGKPYAIFTLVLRNYIREQPAEILRAQMPGFIAGEVVKLVPQLAEKLGHIQPNPALEPAAERARLLDQISKLLLNIAHQWPTLLLLDDIHFADPGSLEILEILLRQATGLSLMVACGYRDVGLAPNHPLNRLIPPLKTEGLVRSIDLERLSQSAVKQLLDALLGNEVSKKFVRSIYQATEGNPFFVEELIKSLAVEGQIVLREGRWEQQNTSLMYVPGSIKALLSKRLEHIKKSTFELLRLASVIGRTFSLNLLLEASPYDDEAIQWAIEEALGAQLIEVVQISDRQGPGVIDVAYQFQHALIRETLYADLRPLRRRQLHRRVAEAMEKLMDAQSTGNPAIVARHYMDGAEDEKAVPYLREAAQIDNLFYANAEAIEHLNQAIEILEDLAPDLAGEALRSNMEERFDLLSRQRGVSNLMGDRDREFEVLGILQDLAQSLADQERWVEVMSRLSTYYWHVGKLDDAEETARRALKVAQENNDMRGEQYALERIARVLWTRRDSQSMEYATRSLMLARELRDRGREGRLTELIGHLYSDTLRDPERAAVYFNQALEICRETNNPYEEAWTLWGMGSLALLIEDYMTALARYNEAKKISEDIGATLQVGWDLYRMGNVWYNLGDYDQALDCYQQAHSIFNTAHHPRGQIYAFISLGLVYLATERLEEAAEHLEKAARQAEERNDLSLMCRSYEALVAYYCHLNGDDNLTNAIRLSNRIIHLAAERHNFEHELLGYYLRGVSFLVIRKLPEAWKSSTRAIDQLEQLNYIDSSQITVAEIYYTHSQIAAALGQRDTAAAFLQKAYRETMRKVNQIPDEALRVSFLNQVTINREIVAASRRLRPQ